MFNSFSKLLLATLITISFSNITAAQSCYWQQHITYKMDVNLDVKTNIVSGKQIITYTNNSPDTLDKIFVHLYWNAFQPNSSMDVRSRELGEKVIGRKRNGEEIRDWDPRVTDRISKLQHNEIGYCRVISFTMDGKEQQTKEYETILEVMLSQPILPHRSVTFNTSFECQVPVQVRRSGRDNAEGIRYSMSQWYPKLVEYDKNGWNPNPYIAREFYGVWGDFDVNLTLDKNYKVAASGILQNAAEIGWGYDKEGTPLKAVSSATRTWKFAAKNVHDFVWAADTAYKHITRQPKDGPLLHFIYKKVDSTEAGWQSTADSCAMAYQIMKETYGAYPWPSYSFIQGGDGGMEYAMATLVKSSSLGTALHEWTHSWYQHLMGTNESLYPWMDEGFTTWGEGVVSARLRKKAGFPLESAYNGYYQLAKSKLEEPMTTHSDHYSTNFAYSRAAYSKGAVFLGQLGYIIGDSLLHKTMMSYYDHWKFKHPDASDFINIAEKASGMQLKWYREYWVNGTKQVDYAIDSLWMEDGKTNVRIERMGEVPMPLDVVITFKDGSQQMHYVPLALMFAKKPAEDTLDRKVYPAQPWTHRKVVISTDHVITDIVSVEIDPSLRMADVDRNNNKLELKW